ncbi:alpha/beta fold hydrolase [Spirosoma sp. KNUC1025]|uniref:alpha/beta fold hydrolase n=1 Tax=Spirosoma sp. KNUC1025 TaxID=2894082 RepID=UPI00386C1D14|nr:alpha/beta hydrolase [Spirosoma sp. KNUC1025]
MKQIVNGVQLNVIEQGNGPLTLVFLHYFGGSALEWQDVMNQLSDQYHCVAVDIRGFGDSEAPNSGYSVDDMADDIQAVAQRLSGQAFVLIGHSMSAKVALALAARQPSGLQSLILLSPSPPVPEPIPDKDRQSLLEGYGQRSAAEETLEKITAVPLSASAQEQIIADNLRSSKHAWDAWLLQGSRENISDRMGAVTVPVHIVVGSADSNLSPDVHRRMVLPYLKNATLDVIDGAGHLLPWEKPDELATFIADKVAR